ncbi:hypothetical protein [Coleofasciculus sp. E2-BRE-01]|uniref:hypothetical protein n=1 Tax=Coleofasciculus sp. E2-BRE-01 TaxID=3069524 RepID=UPI003302DC8E
MRFSADQRLYISPQLQVNLLGYAIAPACSKRTLALDSVGLNEVETQPTTYPTILAVPCQ